MPQKKNPNQGFLTKTYGGVDPATRYPLADKHARNWPELEQEVATQAITENPQAIRNTRSIRPMNFYERFITPSNTEALTWPWGTIALNKDALQKSGTSLSNVLTHELTHVNQNKQQGLMGMLGKMFGKYRGTSNYDSDPDEIAAFEAEGRPRKVNRRDIRLPYPDINKIKSNAIK